MAASCDRIWLLARSTTRPGTASRVTSLAHPDNFSNGVTVRSPGASRRRRQGQWRGVHPGVGRRPRQYGYCPWQDPQCERVSLLDEYLAVVLEPDRTAVGAFDPDAAAARVDDAW